MPPEVHIAGRPIGADHPCLVIAEIGVNHNGDLGLARDLIDAAVDAGADAVKFQLFRADEVASTHAGLAGYQKRAFGEPIDQRTMLAALELDRESVEAIASHCAVRSVAFLCTPFDRRSVDVLENLDVPAYKIASGEITNQMLLAHIASKRRPVILSTGMSTLGEVDDAVRLLREKGVQEIVILQCVSNYPADPADQNLRVISLLERAFGVPVGLSDHTVGNEVALAAVALGATVLEKHLTLDRTLPGPDHAASLEPADLRRLVDGIRIVESALGDGVKEPARSELANRDVIRRSIAAARDIEVGTVITEDMLVPLRPGTGIPPALGALVTGRSARAPIARGELVTWQHLA